MSGKQTRNGFLRPYLEDFKQSKTGERETQIDIKNCDPGQDHYYVGGVG